MTISLFVVYLLQIPVDAQFITHQILHIDVQLHRNVSEHLRYICVQ
jgi:hypothetical protein